MSLLARRMAMMGSTEKLPVQEIGVELVESVLIGKKYDITTGNLVNATSYRYAELIPVNPNYTYLIYGSYNRNTQRCWYDKNKIFISGEQNNAFDGKTLSPPKAARFIGISTENSRNVKLSLSRSS